MLADSLEMLLSDISDCLEVSTVYLASPCNTHAFQSSDLENQELLLYVKLLISRLSNTLYLSEEFRMSRIGSMTLCQLVVDGSNAFIVQSEKISQ